MKIFVVLIIAALLIECLADVDTKKDKREDKPKTNNKDKRHLDSSSFYNNYDYSNFGTTGNLDLNNYRYGSNLGYRYGTGSLGSSYSSGPSSLGPSGQSLRSTYSTGASGVSLGSSYDNSLSSGQSYRSGYSNGLSDYVGSLSRYSNSGYANGLTDLSGNVGAVKTTSHSSGFRFGSGYGTIQNLGSKVSNVRSHEIHTITKHVPVAVPQPYPVTVTKTVNVPQPYPVEVPKPVPVPVKVSVPVEVPKPYPVKVSQPVPYPVEVLKPYAVKVSQPVPVPVEVPRPYPVHITKTVKVPVEKPVYVKVAHLVPVTVKQPYPVPVPQPVAVKVPTPVLVKVPEVVGISQIKTGYHTGFETVPQIDTRFQSSTGDIINEDEDSRFSGTIYGSSSGSNLGSRLGFGSSSSINSGSSFDVSSALGSGTTFGSNTGYNSNFESNSGLVPNNGSTLGSGFGSDSIIVDLDNKSSGFRFGSVFNTGVNSGSSEQSSIKTVTTSSSNHGLLDSYVPSIQGGISGQKIKDTRWKHL